MELGASGFGPFLGEIRARISPSESIPCPYPILGRSRLRRTTVAPLVPDTTSSTLHVVSPGKTVFVESVSYRLKVVWNTFALKITSLFGVRFRPPQTNPMLGRHP